MRKNQRMRRWVLREMDRLSDERQRNQTRTGRCHGQLRLRSTEHGSNG